jgi:endonuclease/exonuclease/phosphatase (EEP) superfamily protein YafD
MRRPPIKGRQARARQAQARQPKLRPGQNGRSAVTVRRSPEPRRFQALLVAIATLAIFPALMAAFLRLVPPTDDASALTASFIPYGMLADLICLVCFGIALVRARHRLVLALLTGLSGLLLILQVIWIAPQFAPNPRPVASRSFTLISQNMKLGQADIGQLRRQADRADIVVLIEVTAQAYPAVRAAFGDRFGFTVPSTAPSGDGTESVILSRYPLTDARRLPATSPQWSATAAVPGLGAINVLAAHPCNPLCGRGLWRTEHRALLARAEQLDNRPEVIAGDFNATDDHLPMRELAGHGFVSGAEIVGAGWIPTFPANSLVPPLIEIDHVLVDDRLTVTSLRRFEVDGTDHLGLIARIARTR